MDPCSRRQSHSNGCAKIQLNSDPSKEGGSEINLVGLGRMSIPQFSNGVVHEQVRS